MNPLNSQLFPSEILRQHNNKPVARGLTIDRIVVYNFWQVMMSTKAIFARQASHHHPLFCVFINGEVYPRRNTCYLFQPSLVLNARALNSVDWLMAFDKKSPLCVHIFISVQNVKQWKFLVGLMLAGNCFLLKCIFVDFFFLGNIRTMTTILLFSCLVWYMGFSKI